MISRMGAYNPGVEVDNLGLLGEFGRPQLNAGKKRDWRASLFDKLNPGADADMSDDDRERLGRAGLMQLASGLLGTGGGFGNALAAGLTGGQKAMSQGVDDMASQQYKRMLASQGSSGGTAFAAKDAQAQAAGYEPGSEGYKNFMKRDNGELARASSAGGQTFEMPDENGIPTRYTFNPQTLKYDKAMLGGVPPMPGAPSGDAFTIDPSLPPEVQAAIRGNEQQWATAPDQAAMQVPSMPQRAIVGRRKEDEAAAVQAATEGVTLGNMPYRNQLEAQGAGMTQDARNASDLSAYDAGTAGVVNRESAVTAAKADAASRAEAVAGLPQALANADQTIAAIDKVMAHPGLEIGTGASGKLDPRNYVPGTDATNFSVAAAQIEGKAFLEAFQSLKGAGQITEVEGQKATAAIARLSRAQSAKEYKAGLLELRGIAQNGKMRAKAKAGRPSPAAQDRPASGALSAAEQSELDQLRAKLGRK